MPIRKHKIEKRSSGSRSTKNERKTKISGGSRIPEQNSGTDNTKPFGIPKPKN